MEDRLSKYLNVMKEYGVVCLELYEGGDIKKIVKTAYTPAATPPSEASTTEEAVTDDELLMWSAR